MSVTPEDLEKVRQLKNRVLDPLEQVIHGKRGFLERLLAAAGAGGHVLVEDAPGLGKTTAAKALARILAHEGASAAFRRIQFTPDLLPYDITGVEIFNQETRSFEFKPGPIFAQVVLADEINRTTPKVQSALLEVMEEFQVTVGQVTRSLGDFFFVMATQNPIEMEGTYPLPAAQLDRFLFKLSMGYPDPAAERRVLIEDPTRTQLSHLTPQVSIQKILDLRTWSQGVFTDEKILDLVQGILTASRQHKHVDLGLSPRAGVLLLRVLKVWALLQGRDFVIDQDVKDLALDALAHRLHLKNKKTSAREVLEEILIDEMAKLL